MKPMKHRKNPAFNDSETSIRKVTPSIIPEEKPSPKIKFLSLGFNKTPKIPPTPVAAPARRLMRVNVIASILASDVP
jgi:hypothetical protein